LLCLKLTRLTVNWKLLPQYPEKLFLRPISQRDNPRAGFRLPN
jgi:hypothetical protein